MNRDALSCLIALLTSAALTSCATPIDSRESASAKPGSQVVAPTASFPPEVVERARKALAEAGLEGDMRLVSGEPATWADSSLGCRMPGQEYAQVITSGHVLRFTGAGRMHTVHVAGDAAIVCSPGLATGVPQRSTRRAFQAAELQSIIDKARADLAARLGKPIEEIHLHDFVAVTWPDGNLGCGKFSEGIRSQAGQAAVAGFKLTLSAAGESYAYHADTQRAIPCPPIESQ